MRGLSSDKAVGETAEEAAAAVDTEALLLFCELDFGEEPEVPSPRLARTAVSSCEVVAIIPKEKVVLPQQRSLLTGPISAGMRTWQG